MSVSTLVISIAIYGLSLNLFVDNNLLCIVYHWLCTYSLFIVIILVHIVLERR